MSTLILCFHRVADPESGGRSALAISPEGFERVLDEVGRQREFVSLDGGHLASGSARAVVTFDDGYADNLHTAMPILAKKGIPATFFITSGFIETGHLFPSDGLDGYWTPDMVPPAAGSVLAPYSSTSYWSALERLSGAPEEEFWSVIGALSAEVRDRVLAKDPLRRPMTPSELTELAGLPGVTIGPHTYSHRRLTDLNVAEALEDVERGVAHLKTQGLSLVPFFAYPFGQKTDVSASLTTGLRQRGFEPLTTLPTLVSGPARSRFSTLGLPRLSVGPLEVPLMSFLNRVLPFASMAPRVWLRLLELRRALRAR